jgi:hypothetical protein
LSAVDACNKATQFASTSACAGLLLLLLLLWQATLPLVLMLLLPPSHAPSVWEGCPPGVWHIKQRTKLCSRCTKVALGWTLLLLLLQRLLLLELLLCLQVLQLCDQV